MMKKLNKKGMTLIELIISFALVSAIVVSMFNAVLSYQNEVVKEQTKSDIIDYKNNVTKLIQDDIIKRSLKSVTGYSQSSVTNGQLCRFQLNFNDGTNKILQIYTSDKNSADNYIMYPDFNYSGGKQDVKYILPSDEETCTTSNCHFTKFASIETNINADTVQLDDLTGTNKNIDNFYLDILITNTDIGGDYHITVVAPLNYKYCRMPQTGYFQ